MFPGLQLCMSFTLRPKHQLAIMQAINSWHIQAWALCTGLFQHSWLLPGMRCCHQIWEIQGSGLGAFEHYKPTCGWAAYPTIVARATNQLVVGLRTLPLLPAGHANGRTCLERLLMPAKQQLL